MTSWILDTDIFTLLYHQQSSVVMKALTCPANSVSITVVTVEEALSGRYAQIRRAREGSDVIAAYRRLREAFDLLRLFPILDFDEIAQERFEILRASHRRIGSNDLRIAAIALETGATLVSRNRTDFEPIRGLTLEDWS